jgi:chromate transporter
VIFAKVETLTAGPLYVSMPDLASLDPVALGLAAVASLALLRFRIPIVALLALSAALGLLARSAFP